MQQKPSGVIARTISLVTRHPLAALILAAISLGTTFLVAREAKSAIKTSLFFVARAIECAGAEGTLPTQEPTTSPPVLAATKISAEFRRPVSVDALPNGDLLISEKPGYLKVMDPASGAIRVVADLTSIVGDSVDNGLYSVVVHPNYGVGDENRVFLFYNQEPDLSTVIASAPLDTD